MIPTQSRQNLALEILLTSGLLTIEDLKEGRFQGPKSMPEVGVLVLNVLVGGLNGATRDEMTAAACDPDMLEAVNVTMWTAVAHILADSEGAQT